MLPEKLRRDLDDLASIAVKQNYRMNSMTLYNFYAAQSSQVRDSIELPEMEDYLAQKGILIVSDGVDIDAETDDGRIDIQPFDPGKIDISLQNITMDNLIKRIQNDEIDLNTAFQRKAGLWSTRQKSRLIESLLLKIPLPAFYFDAQSEDHWLIIDGLQRITAFKEFMISEKLALEGLEFFKDFNGIRYSQLPRPFQRRIEETNLVAYTVRRGTPDNVKYNVFKRINTGGLELEPQEIRHALFQGRAPGLLLELSRLPEFTEATCGSIRTDRMLDQEFVLRFIAVCFYGIDNYTGIPDDFLNDAMKEINRMNEDQIAEIKCRFKQVMTLARQIFDRYAFRKMGADGKRRPINKAIYEIWCKALFDLSEQEARRAAAHWSEIRREFINLCETAYFANLLRASDRKSYYNRFREVHTIVRGAAQC